MKEYRDINGRQILPGMKIRNIVTEEVEEVFETGDGDLGISAVNPAFREKHPDTSDEFYSLSAIGTKIWEVVEEKEK